MRRSTRRLLSATVLVLAVLGALLAGAVVAGRVTFVGAHGVSMNPVYYQGDLVLVARADSYRVGDIVAYRVPAQHMIILHRIIGEADGGFVMKGDHNESIDPTHPTPSLVIGRAALLIPHGDLGRRPPARPPSSLLSP